MLSATGWIFFCLLELVFAGCLVMASSGLTPVGSLPWEAFNSTDQGGLIAILTAFALSLPLLSLPIRVYIRRRTSSAYQADDYAFLVATVPFNISTRI